MARHFANETAVVSPNGELLSHSLEEGIRKWKALPAAGRSRLDDLGTPGAGRNPDPPPGGLILKVFARGLERDATGTLRPYKTEVARSFEPGRDHLWLTEAEWRAMIPADPSPGAVARAPDRVVDRICRRTLIDLVRVGGNGGPRKADDVLSSELTSTVESAGEAELTLRISGKARLATRDVGSGAEKDRPKIDDYEILGFATLDRGRGVLTRCDLLAFSETGHYDEIHKKTLPFGVAFELTRGATPSDRAPPSSYGKDYFDSPPR